MTDYDFSRQPAELFTNTISFNNLWARHYQIQFTDEETKLQGLSSSLESNCKSAAAMFILACVIPKPFAILIKGSPPLSNLLPLSCSHTMKGTQRRDIWRARLYLDKLHVLFPFSFLKAPSWSTDIIEFLTQEHLFHKTNTLKRWWER